MALTQTAALRSVALEDAFELAYREAVRALDHQLSVLTELRSRASMLLAAASITLSLFGQDAFRATHLLAVVAVVCFAVLSVCVIVIVWPRTEWNFEVDPHALLVSRLTTEQPAMAGLTLDLIALLARHRRANSRQLGRVAGAFRIGACLLAIQIVLTVVAASAIV